MILVTQGHEKGIGLEVFFKSILLGPQQADDILLFAHKQTIQKHLKNLGLKANWDKDACHFAHRKVRCHILPNSSLPASTVAMEESLSLLDNDPTHCLFTLPTTKEDLLFGKSKRKLLGHTEYLRHRYKTPELGMFFTSGQMHTLLLTDHLPLKDVPKALSKRAISQKLALALQSLNKLEPQLKRVIVSGINPHAGEGGLLGKEDGQISLAINDLKLKYKKLKWHGPRAADSMVFQHQGSTDLLVYAYHDQGLGVFKALNGTLGANITLGLPFVRLSVDHGTGFDIYGKNIADHRGASFCLQKAREYLGKLHGKNSSK